MAWLHGSGRKRARDMTSAWFSIRIVPGHCSACVLQLLVVTVVLDRLLTATTKTDALSGGGAVQTDTQHETARICYACKNDR